MKSAKYIIDYTGPILSLNDYKSSDHWKLNTLYKQVQRYFSGLVLEHRPPRFESFELRVYHNTGFDLDNLSGTVKPCVDVLQMDRARYVKQLKPKYKVWFGPFIDNDNKTNWDLLLIKYDPNLPKNAIRFVVDGEVKG